MWSGGQKYDRLSSMVKPSRLIHHTGENGRETCLHSTTTLTLCEAVSLIRVTRVIRFTQIEIAL